MSGLAPIRIAQSFASGSYYSNLSAVAVPSEGLKALRIIGQASAGENKSIGDDKLLDLRAAQQALNATDVRVRHSARRHLRDNYWRNPEIVNELLLMEGSSYWERLGAMWAISRVDPLPRIDMFTSDRHSDMVWSEMLKAAIDQDSAIRQSGWRFVMGHPSEVTWERLEKLRSKIKDREAQIRYLTLLADFQYYRGVSILVAEQLDWKGPGATAAVEEMVGARDILREMKQKYDYQVDQQEIAKTIYGEGWALAEIAERSKSKLVELANAKDKLREFLSLREVKSKFYRYSWQKAQSKAYLKSGSVRAFFLD